MVEDSAAFAEAGLVESFPLHRSIGVKVKIIFRKTKPLRGSDVDSVDMFR
jgi:hypothetical protein